jgi:hypothetical protein
MSRDTVRSEISMPSFRRLAVDARRSPQGIRCSHRPDEHGDLLADGWAAASWPAREAGPVFAEAAALPPEDGIGGHDDQRLPPAGPDSGQAGPEQAVGRAELWPRSRSLVHGELLAQGQVLESELAVAADEEGEEPEDVEYESDHESRLWPDEAERSTTCRAAGVLSKDRFGEGQQAQVLEELRAIGEDAE